MAVAPEVTSPPRLEIFLLGTPKLRLLGENDFRIKSVKARALVYYLAMTGRVHTRAALATLLWGDQPEGAARNNLSRALIDVGALAGRYIVIDRHSVAMGSESLYWVDAREFAEAASVNADERTDLTPLKHAITRYQGDFLEGFYVHHAPDFEAWMLNERARLKEVMFHTLEKLAQQEAAQGDLARAIHYGRRLLDLEPWREENHRQLMMWLAQSGQRGAALAQYKKLVQILGDELDVEPASETVALYHAIEQEMVQVQGPQVANLTATRAPTAALAPQQTTLPMRRDRLIGRDAEVEAVMSLLLRDEVGLVTLTGPGGVGKTRVALAVAAHVQQRQRMQPAADNQPTRARVPDSFVDGVWFVDLSSLQDATLVAATVAQALNLRKGVEQGLEELLTSYLQDKRLLLVLDNFEQVMAAASFIMSLLNSAPGVKALITSRETLHISQEYVVTISPLSLPAPHRLRDPAQLLGIPAVTLFVTRAQAVLPTFNPTTEEIRAIADICIRLDGLPLAIELAAARIKLLPPQVLWGRLEQRLAVLTGGARDLPPRQQTLRQTLDWSYHLLTPAERRIFARLAVFVGGWSLEAAESICVAGDESHVSVLDSLQSLIDKNMVRRDGDVRFSFLETLREYALEQLEASGEVERLHECHAAYYLTLAQESARLLFGLQQHATLVKLDTEYGNLRAALQWWLGRDEVVQALELTSALGDYWFQRGTFREGVEWLEQVIHRVRAAGSLDEHILTESYGLVLHFAGRLIANLHSDHEQAGTRYQEALMVGKRTNNRSLQARSLSRLAQIASFRGDHDIAKDYFAESLALWQQLGDRQQIAATLNEIGLAAQRMQLLSEASNCFAQAGNLWRAVGNLRALTFALSNLSMVRAEQGHLREARTLIEEGLAICEKTGPELRRDRLLSAKGWIAYYEGAYAEAQAAHEEALSLAEGFEVRGNIAASRYNLAVAHFAQGHLQESLQLYRQSLDGHVIVRDKVKVLTGIIQVLWSQGDFKRALRVAAAVTMLLNQHKIALGPVPSQALVRVVTNARVQLAQEEFEALWTAGQKLDLETVIRLVSEQA
jgi:predicted ATPase/DNA-binding SARP family transcriptional activator